MINEDIKNIEDTKGVIKKAQIEDNTMVKRKRTNNELQNIT